MGCGEHQRWPVEQERDSVNPKRLQRQLPGAAMDWQCSSSVQLPSSQGFLDEPTLPQGSGLGLGGMMYVYHLDTARGLGTDPTQPLHYEPGPKEEVEGGLVPEGTAAGESETGVPGLQASPAEGALPAERLMESPWQGAPPEVTGVDEVGLRCVGVPGGVEWV